jgi:hypothetical protein
MTVMLPYMRRVPRALPPTFELVHELRADAVPGEGENEYKLRRVHDILGTSTQPR